MAWEFLYSVRRVYQGDSNWGDMYMRSVDNSKWEFLCYTYELPWKMDSNGLSKNDVSRIKEGFYELIIRTDGDPRERGGKGWRLELLQTGHRTNIQIHRAAPNLYIEGCLLPVHFNTLGAGSVKKGDGIIRTKSIELMDRIQVRLMGLMAKITKHGRPAITIGAKMPPEFISDRSHANV